MGANEARHVLAMADDLAKVLALELMTAAQALDLRHDMLDAARTLARQVDAEAFATKMRGAPIAESPDRILFLQEVEALRQELATHAEPMPGHAVAQAHRAIRERIAMLSHDRALDGDVALMVRSLSDAGFLARLLNHGEMADGAR